MLDGFRQCKYLAYARALKIDAAATFYNFTRYVHTHIEANSPCNMEESAPSPPLRLPAPLRRSSQPGLALKRVAQPLQPPARASIGGGESQGTNELRVGG